MRLAKATGPWFALLICGLLRAEYPATVTATAPSAPPWRDSPPMATSLTEPRVLGVPIQDANLISYRLCAGYGTAGHDLLCWTTTAESGGYFCALDLTTWQLDLRPLHHLEAYPITSASDGAIYTGSTSGEIWRYRAAGSTWEVLARPWDNSGGRDLHHIRVLGEGRDGWLYCGGVYGERARVSKTTGEVQLLPAIKEAGNWYVCSVAPLPDGRIAFGLGYVARILIYDPVLGRDVADWTPESWRPDGFVITMIAGPTVLYANHFPSGKRGAFDLATGKFLGEAPWPDVKMFPKWSEWTHSSGEGNTFDYYLLPGTDTIAAGAGGLVHLWNPREAARTVPLAEFSPAPALVRAMQFSVTSDLRVLEHDARRTHVVREREFAQPRVQRRLFGLGLGPDGCIYGGAFQSTHLFRSDPRSGELRDLGDHHPGWGGETYSFCLRGGELVCASYVNGAIVLYDPVKAWDCTYENQKNPRFAGYFGSYTYRPFACTADSRGHVWGVGQAGWGITGGGISWIDPATGQQGTARLPGAPYFVSEVTPGTLLLGDEDTLRWWDAATNTELAHCAWPNGKTPAAVVMTDGAEVRLAFCDAQGLHIARLPAPGKLEIERSFPLPVDTTRLLWDGRRLIAGGTGMAELDPATGKWIKFCALGPDLAFAFVATAEAVYFSRKAELLTVARPGK